MSYYLCQEHKRAFETKRQWGGHWTSEHRGQARSPDDDVLTETVPEGYELKEKPQHPDKAPSKAPGEAPSKTPALPQTVYGRQSPHQMLEEIIRGHPDLPEKAITEVLRWMKYKDFLHPTEVSWILSQISDVPKTTPGLIQTMYNLALSNAQAPSAGGMAPGAFGGPSPGLGPGGYPWGGGGGIGLGGPTFGAPQAPPETPATVELRQEVATMRQDMAKLLAHLDEKDRQEAEEKRDAQHWAELQTLKDDQTREIARLEASNKEAIERLEKQQKEAMESLRDTMRGKGEPPEGAALRAEVTNLRVQVHKAELQGIEKEAADLRARLAEAEKREPTQPTEMGLIQHTADKAIDAAREAGEGLKTLIIGAQKGQSLFPGRRTPAEREAVGKNILAKVQQDQALIHEMDNLFSQHA